jgi:hypothetical protein
MEEIIVPALPHAAGSKTPRKKGSIFGQYEKELQKLVETASSRFI